MSRRPNQPLILLCRHISSNTVSLLALAPTFPLDTLTNCCIQAFDISMGKGLDPSNPENPCIDIPCEQRNIVIRASGECGASADSWWGGARGRKVIDERI